MTRSPCWRPASSHLYLGTVEADKSYFHPCRALKLKCIKIDQQEKKHTYLLHRFIQHGRTQRSYWVRYSDMQLPRHKLWKGDLVLGRGLRFPVVLEEEDVAFPFCLGRKSFTEGFRFCLLVRNSWKVKVILPYLLCCSLESVFHCINFWTLWFNIRL